MSHSRSPSLVYSLLCALSVSATPLVQIREPNPHIGLPFAVHMNVSNGTIADFDRARAQHLFNRGMMHDHDNTTAFDKRASSSFAITNTAITYVTTVGVGSPATSYTLLIDTGSSNTFVGAHKAYAKTKTSVNTGKQVMVDYGSGEFKGTEYTDTVTLSSGLVITNQSIGVVTSAKNAEGFETVDGILGLGPVDLTEGTVQGNAKVPTVSDNLFLQKKISTEVVGVSYAPTTSTSAKNGELTFGGLDTSKFTGSVTYSPITSVSPSKYYWGIDQTITYGANGSQILPKTSGIVDTGTTLVLLATDAFDRYRKITGATPDTSTGLLKISQSQYSNLQSLFFTIGGTKFELTANAQTWPRSLNTYIGGSSGSIYLVIGDVGANSGSGMDFINGYTFLERFYSVYDTSNKRVGIANTANTKATSN